jgi:hypothetical protein
MALFLPEGRLGVVSASDGLLVYAAGEDLPRAVAIPFARKRILIGAVDVTREPASVLAQAAVVAGLVRSIAGGSRAVPVAAS